MTLPSSVLHSLFQCKRCHEPQNCEGLRRWKESRRLHPQKLPLHSHKVSVLYLASAQKWSLPKCQRWHRFIIERYALLLNCWGTSIWQLTKMSHLAALLNLMCNLFAINELWHFLFVLLCKSILLITCTSHSLPYDCLWSSLPACCFIIEIMTGVLYSQFVILCF